MGNLNKKIIKLSGRILLVFLITSTLVLQTEGFNVIRSRRSLDNISPVNNNTILEEEHHFVEEPSASSVENGGNATISSSSTTSYPMCRIDAADQQQAPVDVDLSSKFSTLKFNATWTPRKYFWLSEDFDFEARYKLHVEKLRASQDIVQVFILPHSHNDPGWLNTYEQYYYRQTKHILDNAVRKLTELPEMTFVWSEITYLAKWWKDASPRSRHQFKYLVDQGRLEIATGGWVVPDEATNSLYSLLTELTEGQQWVKNHLNITPEYSWAIDPFGHSATHSHLLKASSLQGMVIQRLHYAWKHWLAEHQTEEFLWRPRWDQRGQNDIPCLSLPYDLYSIKHACGPEPKVCLKFDFRRIEFEYGENYGLMSPITKSNIRSSAQDIVTQYHKTASLTRHNVVLVPLGDDFRYDRALEWDQQYNNYIPLFSYINRHKDRFRMHVRFGTLRDYFEAVKEQERLMQLENDSNDVGKQNDGIQRPSLSGDFFPYGDVYVSGRAAYWTGFYGTRAYFKRFHRQLENELRSAEILFTYANALLHNSNAIVEKKILNYKYQDLISARHEFSVFAHHDGITGTSRSWTMDDYGDKLHASYLKCISIQKQSLKIIYQKAAKRSLPSILNKDFLREKFEWLPRKIPLEVFGVEGEYATKVMVFNNLGWLRTEMVKVLVKQPVVQVTDSKGMVVPSQINPVFTHEGHDDTIILSERMYELVFLANLEPLSTSVYKIMGSPAEARNENTSRFSVISCETCANLNQSYFPHQILAQGSDEMIMENTENRIYFQQNGLLQKVDMKLENKSVPVELSFGMYKPTNRQSGAYLLKPILNPEWQFFQHLQHLKPHIIRIDGPIMSQLISIHKDTYETIIVNTTLINAPYPKNSTGPQGIQLETFVDFSRDYSSRVEAYMRFDSGLNSTANYPPQENQTETENSPPTPLIMYTDQNGFTVEKRQTIPYLEYEGNSYPVTTMAYIQDDLERTRLSVLVDRTHGFCSMRSGRLETLIERKSLYDDGRGMSEGVFDSRPTVSSYILLLETLPEVGQPSQNKTTEKFSEWQPTLQAHKASLRQNYPVQVFVFNEPNYTGEDDEEKEEDGNAGAEDKLKSTISLISSALPENVHLLNLRTLSEAPLSSSNNTFYERMDDENPSNMALVNFQYLWNFESDSSISQCNNTRNVSTEHVETITKLLINSLKTQPVVQFNYVNVTGVVFTSLTGVKDDEDNYTEREYDLTRVHQSMSERNLTQSANQQNSLLVTLKLNFA